MPALTSATAAEAASSVNLPVFFGYLDVSGQPLWAWTGQHDVSLTIASDPLLSSAQVFVGAGQVGGVSGIEHGADGTIRSMTLTLGFVDFSDPDAYDFVNFVDRWSQRQAVIWLGFVDRATGTVVADPVRLVTGRMVHVATTDGVHPGIVVKVSGKSTSDGQRSSGWVLANAHQVLFWPGDLALEFVPQLVGKELRFGVAGNATPSGGGGGGNGGGGRDYTQNQLQ